MGYGDDLMATAYARALREENPEAKAAFGDPKTFFDPETGKYRVYWSSVFENNPNIVQPGEPGTNVVCVPDYPGHRIYIDYARSTRRKGELVIIAFKDDHQAPRGDLFFSDEERTWADRLADRFPPGFIVIEPSPTKVVSDNKLWFRDRWAELTGRLAPKVPIVQLAPSEAELWLNTLPNVDTVIGAVTPTFRHACAVLRRARLFVSTDGGLHHAAAALGLPAVVLWSGFTSPKHLGYDGHVNLAHFDLDKPKGERDPSEWCRENMRKITVDEVAAAVDDALDQ